MITKIKHLCLLIILIPLSANAQERNILNRILANPDSIYFFHAIDMENYIYSRYTPSINDLDLSELAAVYSINDTNTPLQRGNYLKLSKDGENIFIQFHVEDEFNYRILRHTKKPEIVFYDNNGNPLKEITVYHNNKTYKPDPETHLVKITPIVKTTDVQPMTVDHKGVKHYFYISKRGYSEGYEDNPYMYDFERDKITSSYETKEKNNSLDINRTRHLYNEPAILTIKTNAPQSNLKIEAIIKKIHHIANDSVFIPNLLFRDTIHFESEKEITYTLPAKYFPQADIDYDLTLSLFHDKTQIQSKLFKMTSVGTSGMFCISRQGTNITITKQGDPSFLPNKATLTIHGKNKLYQEKEIELPYTTNISPAVSYYKISSDIYSDSLFIANANDRNDPELPIEYIFEPLGTDSVKIEIKNKRHNPFWYTIWKKKEQVAQGYGTDIKLHLKKSKAEGDFIVRTEYMWGERIYEWRARLFTNKEHNIIWVPKEDHHNDSYTLYARNPFYFMKRTNRPIPTQPTQNNTGLFSEMLKNIPHRRDYKSYNKGLHLSFPNDTTSKAKYIIVVDKERQTPFDKFSIHEAEKETFIKINSQTNYELYILSGDTLSYKTAINLKQPGELFWKIDINNLTANSEIIKEIRELTTPFSQSSPYVTIIVKDNRGEPITGAWITIDNFKIEGITDLSGTVQLKIPPGSNPTIRARFIGMREITQTYKGQPVIYLNMDEENIHIDY